MTNKEAVKAIKSHCYFVNLVPVGKEALDMAIKVLEQQPSVRPEIKPIGYRECSDAMLKMWMDDVLTDGEYYRIMDKLNAKWSKMNEVTE